MSFLLRCRSSIASLSASSAAPVSSARLHSLIEGGDIVVLNAVRSRANPIMRRLVAACTALVLAACGTDRSAPFDVVLPALIPAPLHVQHGEGAYRLAADAGISGAAHTDMHATLEWMIGLINEQAGLSMSLTDGPGALRLELEDSAAFAETLAAIDARG